MRPEGIAWTPEEDAILAKLWTDWSIPTSALAERMGRSVHSVGYRAMRLCLGQRGGWAGGSKLWTAEEVEHLRSHYDGRSSADAIAQTTGRTREAVIHKAMVLGDVRRPRRQIAPAAHSDRVVRWVTVTAGNGRVRTVPITLPRVPFIDEPAP